MASFAPMTSASYPFVFKADGDLQQVGPLLPRPCSGVPGNLAVPPAMPAAL